MAYGTILADIHQSSTAGTPPLFYDGSGSQIGTLCRAWVNFLGGASSATVRGSFNVSSVTRTSTGLYVINFSTNMPNINYCVSASCTQNTALNSTIGAVPFATAVATYATPTIGAFNLLHVNQSTGTVFDPLFSNVSVFD